MGDVLIDNPVNTIPPHKKLPPTDSIPNIDSLEGSGNDSGDEYATLKRYQRHLEYINLQEEYIKDEQRSLKRELVRAQEEIKRIQSVPLVIGQFMEAIDQKYEIVHPFEQTLLTTSQHWHRTVIHRFQLCRSHSLHPRPREAQAFLIRRSPPPLKLPCRYPPSRSRFVHCHARCG